MLLKSRASLTCFRTFFPFLVGLRTYQQSGNRLQELNNPPICITPHNGAFHSKRHAHKIGLNKHWPAVLHEFQN